MLGSQLIFLITQTFIIEALHLDFLNDLPLLEDIDYEVFHLNLPFDDDSLNDMVNFCQSSRRKVVFRKSGCDVCTEQALQVSKNVIEHEKLIDSKGLFIKDPVLSHLLIVENDEQILDLQHSGYWKNQPFVFALVANPDDQFWNLYEIQLYSGQKVLVSTWNNVESKMDKSSWKNPIDRRMDFAEAHIRAVVGSFINENVTLATVQNRLNFTINEFENTGYGRIAPNGTWTGCVRQLLDQTIDFC